MFLVVPEGDDAVVKKTLDSDTLIDACDNNTLLFRFENGAFELGVVEEVTNDDDEDADREFDVSWGPVPLVD